MVSGRLRVRRHRRVHRRVAALAHGANARCRSRVDFGKSFWNLIPFTMQMAFVVIGGYIVAGLPAGADGSSTWLARFPKTPKGAVAFVALMAMVASLLSWGFSLIFAGILMREISKRVQGIDYRAMGAAGYLGLGSVWALGLSSSAALLHGHQGIDSAGPAGHQRRHPPDR